MFDKYANSQFEFNIDNVLKKYGLTTYSFAKQAEGSEGNPQYAMSQLYRMKKGKAIEYETLGKVVNALRDVTGEEITVADLLIYKPPTNTGMEQPCVN